MLAKLVDPSATFFGERALPRFVVFIVPLAPRPVSPTLHPPLIVMPKSLFVKRKYVWNNILFDPSFLFMGASPPNPGGSLALESEVLVSS